MGKLLGKETVQYGTLPKVYHHDFFLFLDCTSKYAFIWNTTHTKQWQLMIVVFNITLNLVHLLDFRSNKTNLFKKPSPSSSQVSKSFFRRSSSLVLLEPDPELVCESNDLSLVVVLLVDSAILKLSTSFLMLQKKIASASHFCATFRHRM